MLGLFRFCLDTLLAAVPLFLLVGGAVLFFRLRRVLFCLPRLFRRKKAPNRSAAKSASPVRALLLALAGTLGVGNITGVSLAIATAGAGAVFWMWISALFSMVLKYAEVVLALRYRPKSERERVGGSAGGAMYYMKNGIGGKGGRILAAGFALLCLAAALAMGGAVQANAVAEAFLDGFSLPPVLVGLLLAAATALATAGGAAQIERAASRLVPIAAALYILLTGSVILANGAAVPAALRLILRDAFTWKSASGGILGFLTSRTLRAGVSGGLLSNEAGAGSAPMAHLRAGEVSPARQGLFGICEVALDTFLFCTLSALAILVACPEASGAGGGGALVLSAVATLFGRWAPLLYAASIAVFAFATILCWSYYGENCILWFTKNAKIVRIYRYLFAAVLFLGATVSVSAVFYVTDLVLAAMTWLNVAAVLCLSGIVRDESLIAVNAVQQE